MLFFQEWVRCGLYGVMMKVSLCNYTCPCPTNAMFCIFTWWQCLALWDTTPDTKSGNRGRTPKKNLLFLLLQHLTAYWTFHCSIPWLISQYHCTTHPQLEYLSPLLSLGGIVINQDSSKGNFVFAATQKARSVVSMSEDGEVCFFFSIL